MKDMFRKSDVKQRGAPESLLLFSDQAGIPAVCGVDEEHTSGAVSACFVSMNEEMVLKDGRF
jgi:NADPH-dependent ferric siderophore reductase